MIAKNAPEWWIIIPGLLGAFVCGLIFPTYAILLGEGLGVFILPSDQIMSAAHIWAALVIILGAASAISTLLKVSWTLKVVEGR